MRGGRGRTGAGSGGRAPGDLTRSIRRFDARTGALLRTARRSRLLGRGGTLLRRPRRLRRRLGSPRRLRWARCRRWSLHGPPLGPARHQARRANGEGGDPSGRRALLQPPGGRARRGRAGLTARDAAPPTAQPAHAPPRRGRRPGRSPGSLLPPRRARSRTPPGSTSSAGARARLAAPTGSALQQLRPDPGWQPQKARSSERSARTGSHPF